MLVRARVPALTAGLTVAAAIAMVWVRAWPASWNDFGIEAAPAYGALTHGHLLAFLRLAPPYGGSLELRAPFAVAAGLWGGGGLTVYRLSALPCVLAAAGLALWLLGQAAARGAGRVAQVMLILLCVANPITYRSLLVGHPEELLGGVLCAAAVLAATRGRPAWAGVLLGLAVANKQWALLAVAPVLLALPVRRWLALVIAAATAAVFLAPLALVSAGGLSSATARLAVTDAGGFFHPAQLWWFAGHRGVWVPSMAGQIAEGYRLMPVWLQGRAHAIVVGVALPLGLLAARRSHHAGDPLLLLALLMLLRCALDPWDVAYYALPFIVALLCWETVVRRRAPVFSLAATAATWLVFLTLPSWASVDVQAIVFAGLVGPAIAVLGIALYRPTVAERLRRRSPDAPRVPRTA